MRKVADDLGYRPDQRARLLRQQRSRLLGVTFEVDQAFHGDLIEGIYASAEPAGYDIMLSAIAPTRSEPRAIDAVLDDRCEAIILLGPRSPARSLTVLAAKLPVVTVARTVRSKAVDSVRTDDGFGMTCAVEHLAGLGHRVIAYLDGGRTPGAPERLHALLVATARSGLEDRLVIIPAGPGEDDGTAAAHQLLGRDVRPTAVIAFNDRCAVGAIGTIRLAGLSVPHDISVVGYDNSRIAGISYISLTTVGQNPHLLAHHAVQRAVDRLEGRTVEPRDQIVTPELVLRTSTAPPP